MKSNCFETLNQKITRYAYHNSYGRVEEFVHELVK